LEDEGPEVAHEARIVPSHSYLPSTSGRSPTARACLAAPA
jgi:hypothetical protein